MIPNNFSNSNKGFSLIEVLVSLSILSIVIVSMLGFFTQAFSYTQKNEDKTLGLYVARNMLVYMERQSFTKILETYLPPDSSETIEITNENCNDIHSSGDYVFDEFCSDMFSSTFNNVDYKIKIDIRHHEDTNLGNYIIPTSVSVTWNDQNEVVLEGYIKNDSIR
ncbi:type IV pilus modification PilV family protein [Fredinandcohnia humi]